MIESVLLMMLTISALMVVTRYLREERIIEKSVQGPWSLVSTMIESGVWAPKIPAQIERHPNTAQNRGVTLQEFQ